MRSVVSRLKPIFTSAPVLDWRRAPAGAGNWPKSDARRSPASAAKSQAPVDSDQPPRQSSRLDGRGGGFPMHGRAGVWVTTIGPWPTAALAIAAGAKVPVGTRSTLNIQGPTQVAGAWGHGSEAGVLNGPVTGTPRRNFTGCSNANPRQSSPIQRHIVGSFLPIK